MTRQPTPLADWTVVAKDVAVYTSFWHRDDASIFESRLRTIAVIENPGEGENPSDLQVKLWYRSSRSLATTCEMENVQVEGVPKGPQNIHLVNLLCTPTYTKVTARFLKKY